MAGAAATRPPPRYRRPLPPSADRRRLIARRYFCGFVQSVKSSSPKRNVAQSPEIESTS